MTKIQHTHGVALPPTDDRVDIVMATYNGEKYLPQQIDSLLAQDHSNWRLLIRDDGSTDKTTDIIHQYAARHPQRIVFFDNQQKNLGARGNFGALLNATSAPYVACADQDDVWMKDKISATLARMKEMEKHYGDKPLLVYTDSAVCDAALNVTNASLHDHWKFPRKAQKLERLLVQPMVQGCTTLSNRKLVEAAMPVPDKAIMHDAWLAMVAAATGETGFLDRPTLYYRQHDANVFGAGITSKEPPSKRSWEERVARVGAVMDRNMEQAKLLLDQVGDKMLPERRKMVEDFLHLSQEPRFLKGAKLLANGHVRVTLKSNLGMLFWR